MLKKLFLYEGEGERESLVEISHWNFFLFFSFFVIGRLLENAEELL